MKLNMEIKFKHYAPEQGLEKIQAQLYSDYLNRMPYSVFRAPTEDTIKQRIDQEKKDPKFIQFAFDENKNPLAYIQVSISENPNRIWIGYPWHIEECPKDVVETIFTNILTYAKQIYPDNQVVMGFITETWEEPSKFARDKGFKPCDTLEFYSVDLVHVPTFSSTKYQYRIATDQDVEALVNLAWIDTELKKAFPNKEGFRDYFAKEVIPTNELIMLFEKDVLVAATAPLRFFYKANMMRFTALHPDYKDAWFYLVEALATTLLEKGENEPLLFTTYENWDTLEEKVRQLEGKLVDRQILYCLNE